MPSGMVSGRATGRVHGFRSASSGHSFVRRMGAILIRRPPIFRVFDLSPLLVQKYTIEFKATSIFGTPLLPLT